MDFLDPKRKKSHGHRLLAGYLLMAIVLAMATWLLLNSSFGYWVDPKTGGVIQNGTVFVDSQPSGSTVTLDGNEQGSRTSTRLVLPGSKQYSIKLSNNGYRSWERTFSLDGGKIERITYPLLIPKTVDTTEDQLYADKPQQSSQSIDRKWLLVAQVGQPMSYDLYDLTNPSAPPAVVAIPVGLITDPTKTTTINVVEWAADNRHVLLQRLFNESSEFFMLDTVNQASSVNINTALTVAPTSVSLRDKKADQLYIYDAVGGTLRQGDLRNKTVSGAILSNILAYKTLGSDMILYATHQGAVAEKLNYRIRESDKGSYMLKSVADTTNYLMAATEYDGTPYFVIGSQADDAVYVYRDPLPALKGQSQSPLLISAVLRLTSPKFVTFSPSKQYISVQSANKIVVYDLEGDRQYQVNLRHTIAATEPVKWMDGHHFSFVENGSSYIVDFEGSNDQRIVPSIADGGPYFSPDLKTVVTIAPSLSAVGRYALTQTSLVRK